MLQTFLPSRSSYDEYEANRVNRKRQFSFSFSTLIEFVHFNFLKLLKFWLGRYLNAFILKLQLKNKSILCQVPSTHLMKTEKKEETDSQSSPSHCKFDWIPLSH